MSIVAMLVAVPLLAGLICIPIALVIVLQVFLSKHKNKWLGVILPSISCVSQLLFLLIVLGNMMLFESDITWQSVLLILCILSVPTVVLVAIYGYCRKKYHPKAKNEQ